MLLIPSLLIAVAFLLATLVKWLKQEYDNVIPRALAAALYFYLAWQPETPIEAARVYGRYLWFMLPTVEVLWWAAFKWFQQRSKYDPQ